jgi:hypothetical protein
MAPQNRKKKEQIITTHLQQGACRQNTDPAPEKGDEAKKQSPSKQAQRKATSKAGQLVDYRADLLNIRTAWKLKLLHLTKGGADQAAAADRQKKKTLPINQLPGKTTTELLLKYHHQE